MDVLKPLIKQLIFEPVDWQPRMRADDPTPEEIRVRSREIQDGWDEETERVRRTGKRSIVPYETPLVATHDISRDKLGIINFDRPSDVHAHGAHPERKGLYNNRLVSGEDSPSSLLTAKDVRAIRKSRLSITELSKKYKVQEGTISSILTKKTWRHLE